MEEDSDKFSNIEYLLATLEEQAYDKQSMATIKKMYPRVDTEG